MATRWWWWWWLFQYEFSLSTHNSSHEDLLDPGVRLIAQKATLPNMSGFFFKLDSTHTHTHSQYGVKGKQTHGLTGRRETFHRNNYTLKRDSHWPYCVTPLSISNLFPIDAIIND